MGDLVKSGGSVLVGLLHGANGEISIPKPFEKDIFLITNTINKPLSLKRLTV